MIKTLKGYREAIENKMAIEEGYGGGSYDLDKEIKSIKKFEKNFIAIKREVKYE